MTNNDYCVTHGGTDHQVGCVECVRWALEKEAAENKAMRAQMMRDLFPNTVSTLSQFREIREGVNASK